MRKFEPSSTHIENELAQHKRFREMLLGELPEIDDETLADTLEGLTNVNEMICEIVRAALVDEAFEIGLRWRIEDMRGRKDRLKTRAKKKRALVLKVMTDGAIRKVFDSEFTVSLRKGSPKLQVDEETKIPERFWCPQPPKLDRHNLLAALKDGVAVDGATVLGAETQLSVRTK